MILPKEGKNKNGGVVAHTYTLCSSSANPFRTAVPYRGKPTQISSNLSRERDCTPEEVEEAPSARNVSARRMPQQNTSYVSK